MSVVWIYADRYINRLPDNDISEIENSLSAAPSRFSRSRLLSFVLPYKQNTRVGSYKVRFRSVSHASLVGEPCAD